MTSVTLCSNKSGWFSQRPEAASLAPCNSNKVRLLVCLYSSCKIDFYTWQLKRRELEAKTHNVENNNKQQKINAFDNFGAFVDLFISLSFLFSNGTFGIQCCLTSGLE